MDALQYASKLQQIISQKVKVDEEYINVVKFTLKSFHLFHQYLCSDKKFKDYFLEDAYLQFQSLLETFKISTKCQKCAKNLIETDVLKTSSKCYGFFHFNCSDKIKNKKLYKCPSCNI